MRATLKIFRRLLVCVVMAGLLSAQTPPTTQTPQREGEFQMGSNDGLDDEKPVHTVYLSAFYMDTYEVTVGQYKKFVSATGYRAPDWNFVAEFSPTDNHPIIYVSWHDAAAYAQWASKRLPTEAEWEYAARGSLSGKKYSWGDSIDESRANYSSNVGSTTPGGKYPPNGYGLYDMAGNVWEWCMDEYDKDFYAKNSKQNPVAGGLISFVSNDFANVKTARVLRGGCWLYSPGLLRVARRNRTTPTYSSSLLAFRCAGSVTP